MTNAAAQMKKLEVSNPKNKFAEGFLFESFGPEENVSEKKNARKICAQIYKIRRETIAEGITDGRIIGALDQLIFEIKFKARLSDSQKEEMVLYAVEKCQCATIPEVCEEISLIDSEVKKIVERLQSKDLIYTVRRYVPLSGRPYFALKSRRVAEPEAGEVFTKAEKTIYNNG